MELDLLLEQRAEITKKIQHSIESIKHWFENKIDSCRELFKETKEKVSEKFEKARKAGLKDKRLKDTIKDKNGRIIAKKGENAESVFGKLRVSILRLLNKLKSQCDKIIADCQKGIRRLAGIDDAKLAERNLIIIEEHKKSVIEEVNETASTVALIANVVSSISILTYTAVKTNKLLNDIKNSRSRASEQQDKENAVEAEFSVI